MSNSLSPMTDEKTSSERRVDETLAILTAIGFPLAMKTPKMQRRLARILLAICNIESGTPWANAAVWENENSWALRSRDIIRFINDHYGETIADSSYDDIRRENTDYLVEAGLVLSSPNKPDAQKNDGTRSYAANPSAVDLLRKFGQPGWNDVAAEFVTNHGNLGNILERNRAQNKIKVSLPDGIEIQLAQGAHNELQQAIIEEFLPRFVPNAEVLYVGDTSNKELFKQIERLKELRFFEVAHDRLPDVIVYDPARNWLLLIEAVHSSNPISKLRHRILEKAAKDCTVGIVYVSVFKDRKSLAQWVTEISWETEVWLVESPDHMIHFNGSKFLGPYSTNPE